MYACHTRIHEYDARKMLADERDFLTVPAPAPLSERIVAILTSNPGVPMPTWELGKRIWRSWRTPQDKLPAEAWNIINEVCQRMQRDGQLVRIPCRVARDGLAVTEI